MPLASVLQIQLEMKKFSIFRRVIPGIALFLSAVGYAQDADLTRSERDLVNALAQGNIAEIQLGNLAKKKASNKAVKDFGARMAADHTVLDQQLKQWASGNNVQLPTTMTAEEQSSYNKMAKLSGKEFDREYMRMMLEDHHTDVSELQQTALHSKNVAIKGLATRTLPILQNHLLIAQNVAGSLGLSPKPGLSEPERPKA